MKQERIGNAGQDASLKHVPGGAGFICQPSYQPHRPFLWILLKNIAEKDKAEPASDVLKRSAREWFAQFIVIYY